MLSACFLGTNPLTKYFIFLHEQSFLLGIWAWGPGIPNHMSLSLQWFPRATVEVLLLSNILPRNSLSSVMCLVDQIIPSRIWKFAAQLILKLWGFTIQYLILEHVTKNPHRGNGVLGNQCSLPDYSFHGIAFAKVCGLGEPAIPSFNICVLFYNLLLKRDIHYIFPGVFSMSSLREVTRTFRTILYILTSTLPFNLQNGTGQCSGRGT